MSSPSVQEESNVIKNFMPSWFASVMGTGILALTSFTYSQYLPVLKNIAFILFYFNIALFFVLLIPWTLRWFLYPKDAVADLKHPIVGSFYPTIAIGLLVLSAGSIIIVQNIFMAKIFWWVGTGLTLVFSILIPYLMFVGEHVTLDHVNASWFIPPVGLIVIPIPGSFMIDQYSGLMQQFVIFLNYMGWGGGFFLYLALFAVCMYRFILHKPVTNMLGSTTWVNLGPIGAGTVALFNLVNHSAFITGKEPFFVFGFLFWGLGIWWIVMAILITLLYYIMKVKLPYALSWLAFIFPTGAYVASCHSVAATFHMELFDFIGFGIYWLLVFLWSFVMIKTVLAVYNGKMFLAH